MIQYLKIYFTCVRIAILQSVTYRANFLIGCFVTFLSNIFFPLVTILIYANGATFPGWTMWEVFLIQSIFTMANGIASMVLQSVVWVTMDLIRSGNFETVFLKPISPLFYITSTNFNSENFGIFLGGMIILIISLCHTGISSALNIFSFLILFIAGLSLMFAFNLIMAAVSFKWVGNSRLEEIITSVHNLGRYPLSIFSKTFQIVASLVIPVAVIGFFPASALLGRLNPKAFLSLIPCALFLLFGVWLYNKMTKLYEGVGG